MSRDSGFHGENPSDFADDITLLCTTKKGRNNDVIRKAEVGFHISVSKTNIMQIGYINGSRNNAL